MAHSKPKKYLFGLWLILTIACIVQYKHLSYQLQPTDLTSTLSDPNINAINAIDTQDTNIHILLCSDEHDRVPMYALIRSILINENPMAIDRLYFHILVSPNISLFHHDFITYFAPFLQQITFEMKSITEQKKCIEYHRIASKHFIYKHTRLNNSMNFARFCLPHVFPDVSIGLYLDVDMIVQSAISILYDAYHKEHIAWSVLNLPGMFTDFVPRQLAFIDDYINYNLSAMYPLFAASKAFHVSDMGDTFNAGVLMFNWDIWRKYNWTAQSLELFKFDTFYLGVWNSRAWDGCTQPVMNMLFAINGIRVGDLGEKWNYLVRKHMDCHIKKNSKLWNTKYKYELENAHIIHWNGGCKPWKQSKIKIATADLWLKYVPYIKREQP
eukprot:286971_1